MELEQKIDQLGSAFEQFKKANDQALAEIAKKGTVDPTIQAKVEKADADVSRLENEVKSMQTALNRQGAAPQNDQEAKAKQERQAALRKFFVRGEQSMSEAELKAMSVGTDADGGYIVHPEFQDMIEANLSEISPMRQLATVQKTSAMKLDLSLDLNGVASGWTTETGTRSATAGAALSKVSVSAEEMYANPQVTQALLEDTAVNVEAYLSKRIAESFAKLEGTAFITGDGSGKPKGIMAYAAGTAYNQVEQINSEDADEVTADGLITLVYSLKEAYLKNAKFLMNRAVVKKIRKLKDGNGQYIWQPGLSGGQPATLLGYDLHTSQDMAVEATNSLSVAFGDFKTGYLITDRVGVSILRDPYTNKPYVGFYARKRVGGGVVVSEAIKILKSAVTA